MTEEESRSIKGQTVEELLIARQSLACFRAKEEETLTLNTQLSIMQH